jgi:hypothetical protein
MKAQAASKALPETAEPSTMTIHLRAFVPMVACVATNFPEHFPVF